MDTLAVIVAVLLLAFLFHGEPDVWDVLRAKAMGVECSQTAPKPRPEQKKGLAF